MKGAVIMLQGTASSVGKSLLVTGLCRLLSRQGLKVAPFKAQNLSLNSYVTLDGDEIGRAQATQAQAAGIEPTVQMNPVLLKPEGDVDSQVIVMGKPYRDMNALDGHERKRMLSGIVKECLDQLRSEFDVVVIEGAGSPAEINLRERDIVNMHVALMAQAPVLLIGDIDRGGVFAHLVGTLELLEPHERERVAGLIINKFRGDVRLLYSGVEMIEERTGLPVFGIVNHIPNLRIADEDSVSLDHRRDSRGEGTHIDIAVVRFPGISNFDDFLALEYEEGVSVRYVDSVKDLREADLVILPGTKDTRSDLRWLRKHGIDLIICERAEAGRAVLGVCGGYQMLGEAIEDDLGVEGAAGVEMGLGLLPVRTHYRQEKTTVRVTARISPGAEGFLTDKVTVAPEVDGYEIHMGDVIATEEGPWIFEHGDQVLEGKSRGSVCGTLLHGMFENEALRHNLLKGLGWKGADTPDGPRIATADEEFDRLADVLEESLDMPRIHALLEATRLDMPESADRSGD